jgi:subtilisin family serine protease
LAAKATDAVGDLVGVWQAAIYAADRGAQILNFSWGSIGWSSTEQAYINSFYSMGVLVVAAAGNDDYWTPPYMNYPSAYNHVLSVAATTNTDAKASFTNYGSWVDVSAPGVNIYSTWATNTYVNLSGTSMSSPIVAGLAALLKAVDHSLTPDQITTYIKTNTTPIDTLNPGFVGMLGTGRINAYAALAGFAYLAGDANASGIVDAGDVTYLVRYLKGVGPAPTAPFLRGDANGDCAVLGADIVYLVAYFKGGDSPIRGNCGR